jgi:UDP-N-acetylmuramate--alanine ligase
MEKQTHVHLIGIGGIGISALAQLYVARGYKVSGTNDNPSPQTLDRVRAFGVPVSLSREIKDIPPDVDFFVYSDAWITNEPVFMEMVRAQGKPMYSYFEALGEATKQGKSIVVAGTHGKTTTTAMVAKILIDAGKNPTVVVGSILNEQGSNFVAGDPNLFVIEGCEYLRHFLHLHPFILAINNIELDHTDYYKDLADIQSAFRALVEKIPEGGCVVTNTTLPAVKEVVRESVVPVYSYQTCVVPPLSVHGVFNVANAQTAKTACMNMFPDLDEKKVDASLASFQGTMRRFEYKGKTARGALVYDDYAHHPSEVRATLTMARETFPDKKICVVFHPHLFSRTRDLMDDFASALTCADHAYILPIFAAREKSIEGVSAEVLAEHVRKKGGDALFTHTFDEGEEILTSVGEETVIITMGAGNVYLLANRLVQEK